MYSSYQSTRAGQQLIDTGRRCSDEEHCMWTDMTSFTLIASTAPTERRMYASLNSTELYEPDRGDSWTTVYCCNQLRRECGQNTAMNIALAIRSLQKDVPGARLQLALEKLPERETLILCGGRWPPRFVENHRIFEPICLYIILSSMLVPSTYLDQPNR